MAEIVAAFLGPVVQLLGDYILAPIKRQSNYLCCFNTNVQNFRNEAKDFGDAKADLEMKVAVEENNAQVICHSVNTWLTKSNEIQPQITEIETNISDVPSGCLAIKSRFQLSKKVVKMSKAMEEHRGRCKFDTIAMPPPPASRLPLCFEKPQDFQSRKEIEEDVMKALRERNVSMMGICGMGGLGKTTLAKKVMNTAMEESLFDKICLVVVGQDMDKLAVQQQIAESLGLSLEEKALHLRAQKLHSRLSCNEKILIVVDDIWDAVKLEVLGIPRECTVLLTSRSMKVLNQMDAKVFTMQILNEEEAWSLFSDTAGIGKDNQNLVSIAKQVVKECKGLPLALQILGSASKHEKSEHYWEDTLQWLQSSNFENVPDFLKEVYPSLKRSFNKLHNHAKKLLLLCSQFPEDSEIPLNELTMYSMSLRFFGEISNVERTRNRLFTVVEMLKNHSLLMDAERMNCVQMHDVVRDVAIVIAREEGLVDTTLGSSVSLCEWMFMFLDSSDVRHDHFMGSSYSRITLLSICKKTAWGRPLMIRRLPSFDEMKELTSMTWKYISFEFPETIKFLENLRMLYLVGCNVKSISVFGELQGLEILVCYQCGDIEEVPVEMRRLKHLKILHFECCYRLKRIVPGVIFEDLSKL